MTITAATPDDYIIFGSFQLDLSEVLPLTTKRFSPRVGINADLNTTVAPPAENIWLVNWYLNLNSGALASNPSRFVGSLPKFNLGYADFTWRGQLSSSNYWNYESQRFSTALMWTPTVDALYPSQYVQPTPVTGADLFRLAGNQIPPVDAIYADEVYLQWVNADPTLSNAWIYYQATFVVNIETGAPLSLGDI